LREGVMIGCRDEIPCFWLVELPMAEIVIFPALIITSGILSITCDL
jgi:hypothetical protein